MNCYGRLTQIVYDSIRTFIFDISMIKLSIEQNLKNNNKIQAIIFHSSFFSILAEQWPILKKIKTKDYPEVSSYVSWDCIEEGITFVAHQLDLKKSHDQESFEKIILNLNKQKISKAALYAHFESPEEARLLSRIIINASFVFDDFMSKKKPFHLKEIIIVNKQKNIPDAIHQGSLIGESMHFTRHLAEMPSNICTPSYLAKKAQELAKMNKKIQVSVLDHKEIKALKMNSFLSVSKGSSEDPKFITLQYSKGSKKAPIVFVGKGITFDTGGNSLKPAASMMGMKFDMSGAASVLGIFHFLAQYEPSISVIGLIPTCENIPGTNANKPDDIVTSMSGQTIEILNTDAEGRLILCDALTYAERFDPHYVIDIATLTGACLATFGSVASGLLSNNDELSEKLLAASKISTDKAWPLPLWDEYQDLIKSPVADMANIGGANAGTITAACFLSRFTKNFKWAHLDVAGSACVFQGHKRGSTGRPVPLLIEFLIKEFGG